MFVALERFDLRIPGCRSLKQKRHVIKGLMGAIRSKFDASVAEVDHQELWQRSAIGIAVVGNQEFHVRAVMAKIEALVEAWGEVELLGTELSIHEPDDLSPG